MCATIVDAILSAGGWSESADEDLSLRETLPLDMIRKLVGSYPTDHRTIGLLALTTAIGKWGVVTGVDLPSSSDPAHDQWHGPGPSNGKHLMSYKTGGVGLPHLDVEALASFIRYLLSNDTDIGAMSDKDYMEGLAKKLDSGTHFDEIRSDPIFAKWMLFGLRQKESQIWILDYWLEHYWDPAYTTAQADVRVAFVLSRVWNTSATLARCAVKRSEGATDRVEAILEAYVSCPGGNERYRKDRFGWMKRPIVLFDRFSAESDATS